MRKIQVDRELSEQEVLRINYIIKSRAQRYIASSKEEWLYPEKKLKNLGWMKLGEDLFMPDPRSLTFGGKSSLDMILGGTRVLMSSEGSLGIMALVIKT